MKVLCLGNNSQDTDERCQQLAAELTVTHRGLIESFDHDQGIWHTSVMDQARGRIIELACQADRVIMLNQPPQEWNHPDAWLRTVEIIDEMQGEYQDPGSVARYRYWQAVLATNPSFCILPWVEHMTVQDYTVVCCRSNTPVSRDQSLEAWSTDSNYRTIRQDLIQGVPRPDHCRTCYQQEQFGQPSDRWRETLEWTNRLQIDQIEDLDKRQHPVYFEMRASNRCNLKCRMCCPEDSHLIAHEQKTLGLLPITYVPERNNNRFETVPLDHAWSLYVAGGEPLIMEDFYRFLERADAGGRNDIELIINTNATVLVSRFQNIIQKFSNVTFIISIDGVGAVNDYIRHNSDWQTVVNNWSWLRGAGYRVDVNTTVSIYNAARLHEIFEWLDDNFQDTAVNLSRAVTAQDILNPNHHPRPDLVLASIDKALSTRSINNGARSRRWLETWRDHISETTSANAGSWQRFLDYNKNLDRFRNTDLNQALPEFSSVDFDIV